jgi:hypothetical protein
LTLIRCGTNLPQNFSGLATSIVDGDWYSAIQQNTPAISAWNEEENFPRSVEKAPYLRVD